MYKDGWKAKKLDQPITSINECIKIVGKNFFPNFAEGNAFSKANKNLY